MNEGTTIKTYTMVYWKDDGWLVGRLKERPDVFTQGKTLEELKENILDALKVMEETDEVTALGGK